MDDVRLAALLAYCRLDEPDESERVLLDEMVNAAQAYLAGAGVHTPAPDDSRRPMYDMVVNALVLDDYDNRGSQTAGYTIAENPAFRRKLNQLKLTVPILGPE